ncbi:hypothetical protein ACIQU1_34905 [Streptomyces angustmyceticus]|uniref:hypothetical protein n=1 Tax=Streptomyces angustmyceticus TaxID=285578 RepID=UPI00344B160F
MHHVRRSAALTLLLLLAVAFGPLLCRVGGDQAWSQGRAAAAAAAWRAGGAAEAAPEAGRPADRDAPARPAAAGSGPRLDPDAPIAVAHTPKRCSDRHAPGPADSAPPPSQHRGEPLAPATTGPGPLAADLPAQFALARPPTDSAPARDRTPLLPVLRI